MLPEFTAPFIKEPFVIPKPSDGVMVSRSLLIKSMVARLPSSTSVCVNPARNAVCVLLKTAINASTMSDINAIATRISTSVNARVGRRVRFKVGTARGAVSTAGPLVGTSRCDVHGGTPQGAPQRGVLPLAVMIPSLNVAEFQIGRDEFHGALVNDCDWKKYSG